MKKIIFSLLSISLLLSPSMILADHGDSIDYLEAQSQNAWITQGLAAAEAANINIDYIDPSTSDLMTASKYLLALASVETQDAEAVDQLVSTILNNYNNSQLGDVSLLNDDFWGLMALSAAQDYTYQDNIKNFILDNQNPDGGWSWTPGGLSDSNDTAAAVMALLETDLTAGSPEIIDAIAYLDTTKNEDNGFGYDIDSDSDGASTAWIISALHKADINTSEATIFLNNLKQGDGSYLWMPGDASGSVLVTAYALVALSDSAYPVNYIDIQDEPTQTGVDLRIEGPEDTICLATGLQAVNVLALLEVGSQVCDFEYIAEETEYGVYVSSIDGIDAEGMSGWQYWVNWQPGMVSAPDYLLVDGDSVLWGYGGWPTYAGKIVSDKTLVDIGESFVITATYFDGDNWQAWSNAEIHIANNIYQTDVNGQVDVVLSSDGVYSIFAQADTEYVRSNKVYVTAGNGISQTVDLVVNIPDNSGGNDTVAFIVDQSSVNFGDLSPGQAGVTVLSLSNTGELPIYIEANINGHQIFTDNTLLDQSIWEDYNLNLAVASSSSVDISLTIPDNWNEAGQKNGQLIFWAVNN
jgi:hypothetical protein